jgi:predicted nuclease of predicted toxin-antitoxin system
MQILFDHGTPRQIARWLESHVVVEAKSKGWETFSNGALLDAAESAGFDLLVTTDKNMEYQQNLRNRKIAIVVLGVGRWRMIKPAIQLVVNAVASTKPGTVALVDIPLPPRKPSRTSRT